MLQMTEFVNTFNPVNKHFKFIVKNKTKLILILSVEISAWLLSWKVFYFEKVAHEGEKNVWQPQLTAQFYGIV